MHERELLLQQLSDSEHFEGNSTWYVRIAFMLKQYIV